MTDREDFEQAMKDAGWHPVTDLFDVITDWTDYEFGNEVTDSYAFFMWQKHKQAPEPLPF